MIRISIMPNRSINVKLRVEVVARVVGITPLRVVGIIPVVEIVPVRVVEMVPVLVVDIVPFFAKTAVEKTKIKSAEQTVHFVVFIAFSCAEISRVRSTDELF